MKRKLCITVPAAILLLALYFIIFDFSAQDADESGSVSQLVTQRFVEWCNGVTGSGWNADEIEEKTIHLEHPVRKLAHFSEYACMGILVCCIVSPWLKQKNRLWFITTAWVFLSAAGDELHQYFVPGRYASVKDVLLDTCGGVFGMLLFLGACRLLLHRRFKGRER